MCHLESASLVHQSLKSGLWKEIGMSFTIGKISSAAMFIKTCADTKRRNIYGPHP